MSEPTMGIRRALISVSDKSGIEAFAQALNEHGIELISTGGTARLLRDAGQAVKDVSDITGFPEMMDGRLKSLHPVVHGGLLAIRGNADHEVSAKEHGISPIDLLVVNLYPFEETVAGGANYDTCVENIDIGGPAMIRAAAKNHAGVTVVVDPNDYQAVLDELVNLEGATSLALRKRLAAKAYARTSAYDSAIATWFADEVDEPTPTFRSFSGRIREPLRYGENPHQWAAFYVGGRHRPGVATAEQIQGKALSYNNINDTNAAYELVAEFDPSSGPAVAIIKHANPCGVAQSKSLVDAYRHALQCDPVSAFGGIIACNVPLDGETAEEIAKIFTEVVVVPDAKTEALKILSAKKDLRVLMAGGMPDPREKGVNLKLVSGGLLVQSRDNGYIDDVKLKVVSKRPPSAEELADLKFAFKVCKHVKSNAIIYAKNGATVGIGAGQMSRVDSARIAAWKAQEAATAAGLEAPLTEGSVVASDAFFPFADGLLAAAEAGVTAVIQPGGSIRDEEVIAAADEKGLAMVLTGMRHFLH